MVNLSPGFKFLRSAGVEEGSTAPFLTAENSLELIWKFPDRLTGNLNLSSLGSSMPA